MKSIFINSKSYLIKEVLGQGSFGTVYKAEDQQSKRLVAIKVQNQITQNEYDLIQKFRGQNFKNLVNIFDFQCYQNQIIIVMELGLKSLQEKIQIAKVPPKEARYVMQQIANGIKELHSLGIAHRDLKPENILIFTLEDQGQTQEIYKICDFGTTKDFQNIKTPCIGTPYYLAPEQLNPNNFHQPVNYNQSVDIWAFGAVMYELFTNTPIFNGKTIQEIYDKIMKLPIEEEIRKLQNLEDKYKDLLIKMLQRNPQNRITIQEIKNELSNISHQNLVNKQVQPVQIQKVSQPGNLVNQQFFQRGRRMFAEGSQNQQKIQNNPFIVQQPFIQGNKHIELQKVGQLATLQKPLFKQNNININQTYCKEQQNFKQMSNFVNNSFHKDDKQQINRPMYLSPQR